MGGGGHAEGSGGEASDGDASGESDGGADGAVQERGGGGEVGMSRCGHCNNPLCQKRAWVARTGTGSSRTVMGVFACPFEAAVALARVKALEGSGPPPSRRR